MRHQIVIKRKVKKLFETYCDVTGENLNEVVDEALTEWLTVSGSARMEAVVERRRKMPAPIMMPRRTLHAV